MIEMIENKDYPKTYEECCDILQLEHTFELRDLTIDEEKLMDSFIRLKRCRDAYWKIAGEEMGLDKPWEPDWKDDNQMKLVINFYKGLLNFTIVPKSHFVLTFPNSEMRYMFCKNFEKLIEQCKELL